MTHPPRAEAWLHPVALASLAVLLVNDHVLKRVAPGWLSGKLSDVAILVVGPLALQGIAERVSPRGRTDGAMLAACALTGVAYALEKTVPAATEAYRVVWGCLRWPIDVAAALATGRAAPGWARVAAVTDPTDLVTLPALWLAWRVHRACDNAPPALADSREST